MFKRLDCKSGFGSHKKGTERTLQGIDYLGRAIDPLGYVMGKSGDDLFASFVLKRSARGVRTQLKKQVNTLTKGTDSNFDDVAELMQTYEEKPKILT